MKIIIGSKELKNDGKEFIFVKTRNRSISHLLVETCIDGKEEGILYNMICVLTYHIIRPTITSYRYPRPYLIKIFYTRSHSNVHIIYTYSISSIIS